MRALLILGIVLAFGCVSLTPAQKEAQKEAREYRDQEYYETVYLPKKMKCGSYWVIHRRYGAIRAGHDAEARPHYHDMRAARCISNLNELY